MTFIDDILVKLAKWIQQSRYEPIESDTVEIKPVPPDKGSWKERHKSVNAFLNTRGGILILGIKEDGQGAERRYIFTGWQEHAEGNIRQFPKLFSDKQNNEVDLVDCFPPFSLRPFLNGQIAIIYVSELAADRKYVFQKGEGYRRIGTGDVRLLPGEIEAQEEYKREVEQARELQPVSGTTPEMIDLDKLNDYITRLNQGNKIETIKPDLVTARPFLERKCFVKDNTITTLGMLVCGQYPGDRIGFRCHVHGYVDAPNEIAKDKQDMVDNILPLMEAGYSYLLRNIHVGVSVEKGGSSKPQYPDELLRETINNALAHRDYSIDRQVIIAIKPGNHILIRNPGTFRAHLLIEALDDAIPLRRIIPEAKPRNPKLADVLRVYRKWEGRGIGMATLVDLALQNQIDLPYYRFRTEEVELYLCAGQLLDDRMELYFEAFDRYIEDKTTGIPLSEDQKLILAYLMKSEWANEQQRYTIVLTADNNHLNQLNSLEHAGLVTKHVKSTKLHPVYIVDRVLMNRSHLHELRELLGSGFDSMQSFYKEILQLVYRFNRFSKTRLVSAKRASFALWFERFGSEAAIKEFDAFYRRVRSAFNKLELEGFVQAVKRSSGKSVLGYVINENYKDQHLV